MVSIDLKDAYFLISVHEKDRKYLRFTYENTLYQFTCAPFGLAPMPYVFTKLLKPVLTLLRKKGIICSMYLDDLILMAPNQLELICKT